MALRKVKVQATVYTVVSGILGLSAEQARTRVHNLKPVRVKDGAGEFEVVRPVQFKRGEEFGYSGEVSKSGELHDPEAEEVKRLQNSENTRAELRAEYNARLQQAQAELAGKVEAAKAEFVAGLLARLPNDAKGAVLKVIDEMKAPAAGQKK